VSQRGLTRRGAIAGAAAGAAAAALPANALAKRKKRHPAHTVSTAQAAEQCTDVAIVGAGVAGLTAARRLAQAGKKVLVLEARDRVGGRTLNHDLGGGRYAELGGMFTGPTQDRIQALAGEVGVGQYPTFNDGNNVFFAPGPPQRKENYPSNTPLFGTAPPDPVVSADIVASVAQLDNMASNFPVEAPWTHPNAAAWDRQTLDGWLRQHSSGSADYMALVSAATNAIFGCEPEEISLLYTVFYIASSGNAQNQGTFERNFDTAGGAQQNRFVGGAQQISIRVAQQLGSSVILNAPVRKIDQSGSDVIVVADTVTVRAQKVIVAIPPALAGRIEYSPTMPPLRDQLTQRAPQGSLMKFEAIYPKPFWRAAGLSGQVVSEQGPVKVTFDTSPQDGSLGIMMGFIGGTDARTWSQRSAQDLQNTVLQQYATWFGSQALNPSSVVTFSWMTEEWNRGCPVMVLPPNVLSQYGPFLRAPVGSIHWAGTETADYWAGYMDGAVRSGERAAQEVLPQLGKTPTCPTTTAAPRSRRRPAKSHRHRSASFTG
jgi:monoamine oxidase